MAVPNSPSEDISAHLATAGIGTLAASSGWGIFASQMPESPHTVIAVFTTGGLPPDPKWLLDRPFIQVRVRGGIGLYEAAFDKAQEIKDEILGMSATTIGGSNYISVTMLSDITFIMYDDNRRPIFTANYQLHRQPSDATNRVALS